ncbi:MAG: chitobiase/beta-hexosaminidase C-terminal domain-containing protein [Bacteroidales bacterium]|nr:chitobiase/beta-hexosaminidase C-terminal domain-containing protein [Bacteroidales bacterium]
MKNLRNFALAAFALLGFAACQQEEFAPEIKNPTHSVTFVAGAPETKTTANIEGNTVNYAWTKADEGRFTVYENGTAATETVGILDDKTGKMTLMATFTGDAPASPKYQALYNSEVSAIQNIVKNSYAEVSDVMVSNVLDGPRKDDYLFRFKREVAFAKMTLKGLTSGAHVSSVRIESDKPIAGKYDLETGTFVNTSNVITLDVFIDVVNGNATVWFTTIPVEEAKFTITAETTDDAETVAATYTKPFAKTITLTRGNVKGFGVAMVKDAPKTYGYQKISSVEDYAPGDYIIVAHAYKDDCPTKGDFAIANSLTLSSNKLTGQDVTSIIDNDVIYASDGANYKLSLSGDKDNIEISNGTDKLGWDTKTNLKLNAKTTWSLSLNNGNGGSFILLNNSKPTGETERTLAFQSYTTSGTTKTASLKFAAYAVSNVNDAPYAAIELYKYQEVTPPTPKYSISFAEVAGGTLSATPSKAEAGAEVTLTATPYAGYAFNNDWTVKDANEAEIPVTDGKFTMPAKDVTVSGSFRKVDYTITKATCEGGSFTVTKNGVEVTKAQIDETITLTASAEEGYEFDSWSVTNETTSKSLYVNENTFTMPGANVTVSANFLKADEVPVYASVADLIAAGTPTSKGVYVTVTLSNEEITKFFTTSTKARRGVYFTVGTQEIELFGDIACPEEWVAGGWVSGTLAKCKWMIYNGTWELCPTGWTELTYAAPCATPVITLNGAKASITCATEGATIRYTLDGTDPVEASEIYSDVVTLTDGQTIKAKAFLTGHKPSEVASKKYSSTGGETTYSYKFTSKAWAATLNEKEANWTSGKDGNGYSNNGVQVTTGVSGANATSPNEFINVSKIVVRYCTNSKAGNGTVTLKVGENQFGSQSISAPSSGGTTEKSFEISTNTPLSGKVNISVTCSKNSIYIIGIDITAK